MITGNAREQRRRNMKIGLFTDTFYPEINGVATSSGADGAQAADESRSNAKSAQNAHRATSASSP